MKITQNGMACCSVVVGRDATWLEHHTAQELRSYIQKISGAVLLVVPEHDAQSVPGEMCIRDRCTGLRRIS